MDSQTVSVAFGPGLDSKTDPKVSAKPILIQDGIFTNPHRISKRNGYDLMTLNIAGGGTIANPTMNRSYRNELVVAGTGSNGPRLFSYSSSQGNWIDCGKYCSVAVSKQVIASPELWASGTNTYGVINSSGSILSSVSAYAYDNVPGGGFGGTFVSIIDNSTGSRIYNGTVSSSGTVDGYSRLVCLGTNRFAVFYVTSPPLSSVKLCYQTITVSSGVATFGSEVVLNAISTGNSASDYVYDVITTSGGCFVALGNGSAVVLYTIDTSGSVTHGPTTIVTGGAVGSITLQLDTSGTNAWVYWLDNLTAIKYAIYNASTLSNVLTSTSVATGLTNIRQLSALATSTTTQKLYWSSLTTPGSGGSYTNGVFYPIVSSNTANQTGTVGTPAVFLSGVDIYSKPFTAIGLNLMAFVSLSNSNPVGVVIDLSDKVVVSKFLPGSAEGVYFEGYNEANATYTGPQVSYYMRHPGFVVVPYSVSLTQITLPCCFVVSISEYTPLATGNLAAYPSVVGVGAQTGICAITLDFNHIDSYQSLVQQDTLVLNGGIVSQYDGSYVSELGFTIDPDQVTIQASSSSGNLTAGKYVYYVIYEWTDANGNIHRSAPSIGVVANFTSGSSNSVTINYANSTITQKQNVMVRVYRTIANGTIPYFVVSLPPALVGFGIGAGAGFQDQSTDAVIQRNPTLYTEGGAVLDNIAPPPAIEMWTRNNRVWVVDSEDPETKIEYCKTASPGTGISFSSGFLEYLVDSKFGNITGGIAMDEKMVILKENGIAYCIGDGADDSGNNASLTPIQFIPSDVGCSNGKSVVSFPDGIMFRSNGKGLYLITRGASVVYFGYEVEAYNSQDIRSAVILHSKNQIRLLTSSGSSLLYDYVMKQWSVFTNHAGLSADIYGGAYVYVRPDGSIYSENTTSFLDDSSSYALTVQLQWIKAQSIQGFERLKRIAMLGDFENGSSQGHGVQISAAYDFGTSFSSPVPYYFGEPSTSSSFQYRERLARQKCDAVQLYIQEIVTGQSGEYCDFTDLGLEISAKRGLNKLPGYRSVG